MLYTSNKNANTTRHNNQDTNEFRKGSSVAAKNGVKQVSEKRQREQTGIRRSVNWRTLSTVSPEYLLDRIFDKIWLREGKCTFHGMNNPLDKAYKVNLAKTFGDDTTQIEIISMIVIRPMNFSNLDLCGTVQVDSQCITCDFRRA